MKEDEIGDIILWRNTHSYGPSESANRRSVDEITIELSEDEV